MQLDDFTLKEHGFAIVPSLLSPSNLEGLRTELDQIAVTEGAACVRDLLRKSALVADWVRTVRVRSVVGSGMVPVRALLFDKCKGSNWPVAWHQDLTIAVDQQMDLEGFGPWSVKHGVQHVQPPASVLEQMLTLRLHLDDTPACNGALLVSPSSHLCGRLTDQTISSHSVAEQVVCACKEGEILMMRPLLLHASRRSERVARRRVVHVDFAPEGILPEGLDWYESSRA